MDVSGYLESDLLAGFRFTYLLLAIDIGDLDLLDQAERFFNIDSTDPNRTVDFEYHGSLRFDGEAYVVQARGLDRWTDVAQPGRDRPDEAVGRMVACVEIAHTFRGACGAFADMLRTETRNLTGGYICEVGAGRSPQELNRLRILTLAVVSLTNFSRVTPIDEDRRYFSLYEQHAMLSEEKQFIQESCELLYNALQAELQWQQSKQDRLLGYFLAGLTSLTLISVLADAYSFVSGQNEALIQQRLQRMTLLLALVLLSATLVLLVVRPGNRRTHRQASFPVSRFPSADSKRFRRRRRQRTVQSRSGESP
jgi:hypothetical protein